MCSWRLTCALDGPELQLMWWGYENRAVPGIAPSRCDTLPHVVVGILAGRLTAVSGCPK